MILSPGKAKSDDSSPASVFRAGTLLYTRMGLLSLFGWLLWGDFAFMLMDKVWHNVLPLQLKSLGASNVVMSLLVTTIPSVMNFVLNPLISTASDRYRSRLGRRIPFMLFATPFMAVFLVLFGFAPALGNLLARHLSVNNYGLNTSGLTIALIFVLIVGFRFFDLFVGTVYWYLFNDVVPPSLLGRFLGLFRVVGSLTTALFNFVIYRFAGSHTKEIFIATGIIYGVGFTIMCLKVKEGEYPPPSPRPQGKKSVIALILAFIRECFCHRIFILVYLAGAMWALANCMVPFAVFHAISLGLSIEQFGTINGMAALLGVLLTYPAGILVDRFHPLRVMLCVKIVLCCATPLNLIFLFFNFSPHQAFWIYGSLSFITLPLTVIFTAAALPMLMKLFPHDRFGQFCAANAMMSAATIVAGGVLVGIFLDFVKTIAPVNDYYYRFAPCWNSLFVLASTAATYALYRSWKALGGVHHYKPPINDAFQRIYSE